MQYLGYPVEWVMDGQLSEHLGTVHFGFWKMGNLSQKSGNNIGVRPTDPFLQS